MFQLNIVEPEKYIFQGKAQELNLNTSTGRIGILENHTPLLETVVACEMNYTDENNTKHVLAISSGWLIIRDNNVTLYINSLEYPHEIDIEKAMADRDEAQRQLEEENLDMLSQIHIKLALEKAINRINVYNKK